ncbi:MAG TPA: proton-conducting transporter membrane subunit [Pirellulales bacterium]|jgi:NADH-quinone oxidoreductase subunit M|nr:proton-conducting transporter membrane subunit [Pirellulales bacterium]
MNAWQLPWLELAMIVSLVGSPLVSRLRDPERAYRWGLALTGLSFACSVLAWIGFDLGISSLDRWSVQPWLFGRQLFALDDLNAPLIPLVALLHFLTALATARTHMRRFSFSWSLAAEATRLATFSCKEPWPLIVLLIVGTVPPYVELVNRGRPTRVYLLHMLAFAVLLVGGWAAVESSLADSTHAPWWATVPLLAAILIRCGTVPVHCWLTDWFEHASLGITLLYVIPLSGVYAAVRLVLPIADDWMLTSIGLISLATAVYAAGMATIQRETRRFFAHLFLSHASLVLVGLELHNDLSLTGALSLWLSVILAVGGFGLSLRALESRFGRLSLTDYHGLYEHSPTLAVCFLLTGLASVGFPATIGFISTELLVDGAIEANPSVGVAVVAAAALNGIAVLRAYFRLFTGARHVSTVSLGIGLRERIAVLTLAFLILLGGLIPQPGISSRQRAAQEILAGRMPVERRQTPPPTARRKPPARAVRASGARIGPALT